MGVMYSCGTTIDDNGKREVGNCARQLALRHKFLAAKRAELVISLSDLKRRNASKHEMLSVLGRVKSLDSQIQKIVGCHTMFESMKEATDTTNLLSTVRDHLKSSATGDVAAPDPDTIYDLQDSLEIASDALRDTNEALGSEWKLEAYTQRDEMLEAELEMYLSPENRDHPSGPDSQSLEETSDALPVPSETDGTEEQHPWEQTREVSTPTEEPPSAVPSLPNTPHTTREMAPSSTSPSMDSKPRQKPLLSA